VDELEFTVTTAQLGEGAFVVSVAGEADLHTTPDVERELQQILQLGGRTIVLDLGDVGFIDSTVVSLLLRLQPRFRARGGDIVLVSDDRRVLRTLEIMGLDRILRIERRLDEALSGLTAERAPGPPVAPEPAEAA
jgi:anti-sigma B factor antagonist